MFGGRRKPWSEMTRREIFSSLTAFTIVWAAIVSLAIYRLTLAAGTETLLPALSDSVSAFFGVLFLLVYLGGLMFVVIAVCVT